jgi:hypothetical protein
VAAGDERRLLAIQAVARVQSMPYDWPVPPDAEWTRRHGRGSCASKHALLDEQLEAIGIACMPLLVMGPLVPPTLRRSPGLVAGASLVEIHECLTVLTPWAGPLRVDVTWDPVLVMHGLPGTLAWSGDSDMDLAVDGASPGWAVPRPLLRVAKEALRSRMYTLSERRVRDRTLATLAQRFQSWRADAVADPSTAHMPHRPTAPHEGRRITGAAW